MHNAKQILEWLQNHPEYENLTLSDIQLGEPFSSTAAHLLPIAISQREAAAPQQLLLKRFRPDWFWGGVGEAKFFAEIAAEMTTPPTFRCYHAHFDIDERLCVLLLEDVSQTHSFEPPRPLALEQYQQLLDALLQFHIHWWEHPRLVAQDFLRGRGGPLCMADGSTPALIRNYCATWRESLLPQFVDQFAAELSPETVELVAKAINAWETHFVARIENGRSLTLLHGDFHAENVCYPNDPTSHTLYLADWETYKRGIGPYDLCYLLGEASTTQRREIEMPLLHYYHEGLLAGGVKDYSWEACLADYRLAVIANLFPPIAWKRPSALRSRLTQFDDWDCHDFI